LILGGIAVVVCYFFVDRPVAWLMNRHRFHSDEFLLWPSLVFDGLAYLLVLATVVVVASRLWRPASPLPTLLVAMTTNLVVTTWIKDLLKWAFGRAGPAIWISNGVYGFHPFDSAGGFLSFPSGHAAATFAVISLLWRSRPQWRSLYLLVGGLICGTLVGLNYHFVGDVIAGTMLGSVTGAWAARIFRLQPLRSGGRAGQGTTVFRRRPC
jgi:membrane-associated phospholipid phosphatase